MRRQTPLVLLAAVVTLAGATAAGGATSPEQELADKYAPVVALKTQEQACDTKGEPFRPVEADLVLGRSDVRLVNGSGKLLKTAPTPADLIGRGENTYLDFPGSPLDAGCSYEKWAKEITAGTPTISYAHIGGEAGKPGKLALQYWFYYPFNDFNNKHESDWEMIQLMFDASTAEEALAASPTEVGFSQHAGAERADWDSDKLQKQGSHPITFPGAGSHANYFRQSLWLGHGPAEGFGCDDTRAPTHMVETQVELLPTVAPTSATAPFAWLGYEGHWGQKESGPNTGPTGPNMKTQWTEPVTWSEDEWRSDSTAVPMTGTFGPSATSFFCGAVAAGSKLYLRFLRTPWFVVGVLAAIAIFGVWLSRQTRWSPAPNIPVDQVRSGGAILNAAWRLYRDHPALFLGIGVLFIPLGALAAIAQQLLFSFTWLGDLALTAGSDPIVAAVLALLFGQVSTIVATILVTSAVAVALERMDAGEHPEALGAYRRTFHQLGSLAWAWVRIIVVAGLLTITIVGIPFAVVYLVRKAVVTQACVIEDLGASPSLRRSSELVSGHGPRVFAITGLVNVTAFLIGPIVGVLFLFLSPSSLAVINVISSIVYVAVMPYVGIAIALLFYDLRRRLAGEEPAPALVAQPSPTGA